MINCPAICSKSAARFLLQVEKSGRFGRVRLPDRALFLGPEAVSFPETPLAGSLPYESGNFRIAITITDEDALCTRRDEV